MAFEIAGSMALKEAARRAHPVILEPLMLVEVKIKEGYMGTIMSDLNHRRGRIENIVQDAGSVVIHAVVPLSEVLRSSARGRPDYSMRFVRYEEAPLDQDPGPTETAVTANKPKYPKPRSGFAARSFGADSD